MTSVPKVIDMELALQEKIPDIYKKIPGVLLRLMDKIIRQDDMNRLIHDSSHLHGILMVDWAQKVREYVYLLDSEKFSSASTIPAFSEIL